MLDVQICQFDKCLIQLILLDTINSRIFTLVYNTGNKCFLSAAQIEYDNNGAAVYPSQGVIYTATDSMHRVNRK